MAVGQGFEPREGYPSTVFKTAAFDRSASPPETFCRCGKPQQAWIIQLYWVLTSLRVARRLLRCFFLYRVLGLAAGIVYRSRWLSL